MVFKSADICADPRYALECYFAVLYCNRDYSEPYSVTLHNLSDGEWGISRTEKIAFEDPTKPFCVVEVCWLSPLEYKFYYISLDLDKALAKLEFQPDSNWDKLLFGVAPFGELAIWAISEKYSILLAWEKGQEVDLSLEEYLQYKPTFTLKEYCDELIESNSAATEVKSSETLSEQYLDRTMRQFALRYIPTLENYEDSEWVERRDSEITISEMTSDILNYDGTFRKDMEILNHSYGLTGIPKKVLMNWKIGKTIYSAKFLLSDEIVEVFQRFYGAHPETKADFIIRMDPEKRKYELALYRQGLKEPVVIPQAAYQLIVFKNKFEDYRSENYNQSPGAWNW